MDWKTVLLLGSAAYVAIAAIALAALWRNKERRTNALIVLVVLPLGVLTMFTCLLVMVALINANDPH